MPAFQDIEAQPGEFDLAGDESRCIRGGHPPANQEQLCLLIDTQSYDTNEIGTQSYDANDESN